MPHRLMTCFAAPALLLAAQLASGCGNPTVDACNRWQESLLALECVPDDYQINVDCSEYNDYPCDASPYFDCLEQGYSCSEDGQFQEDTTACVSPC